MISGHFLETHGDFVCDVFVIYGNLWSLLEIYGDSWWFISDLWFMMSYGDFGHESRHSRPGTIIKLSSYGGFLKYGYPKSSKSLNHFSIETNLGISHDLNTKKHISRWLYVRSSLVLLCAYHCMCHLSSLFSWANRFSPMKRALRPVRLVDSCFHAAPKW